MTPQEHSILKWYIVQTVIASAIVLYVTVAQAEVYDSEAIADAVYLVEGGVKAKRPYGVLSVPCHSEQDCRQICINTINNTFTRWQSDGSKGDFLSALARRYAPVGAGNDPQGLNRNWESNLRAILKQKGGG